MSIAAKHFVLGGHVSLSIAVEINLNAFFYNFYVYFNCSGLLYS